MDKQKLIDALQSDGEISAAILFGSVALGQADQNSDIDIALLYNPKKDRKDLDLFQIRQNLSDLMGRDVDIVVLNDASPIVSMQAIKNGIPLFIRDKKVYQNFEIQLITDYADLKILREPFEKNILKRKLHD
jgi:predicted nucleotidyltransferase